MNPSLSRARGSEGITPEFSEREGQGWESPRPPTNPIRALSLTQPWASLVIHGLKQIETRGRRISHRGLLAIHATRFIPEDAGALAIEFEMLYGAMTAIDRSIGQEITETQRLSIERRISRTHYARLQARSVNRLPKGAVLGIVDLIDCIPAEQIRESLTEEERDFGNYADGRFAWQMRVLESFETPIPAPGKQGIWWWTDPRGTTP